jgi:hypothetical protein
VFLEFRTGAEFLEVLERLETGITKPPRDIAHQFRVFAAVTDENPVCCERLGHGSFLFLFRADQRG